MNTVKNNDGVIIRECFSCGVISLMNDLSDISKVKLYDRNVSCAVTGKDDTYTLSLTDGTLMMSTLLNSDHILIMKQILNELGEI